MNIFARTALALATLGIPYGAGKYIPESGEVLSDLYLTYILVSSVATQAADNRETERKQRVQITAWSRDDLSMLPDIAGAMVAAGFTRGEERQLPRDPDTGHVGLAMDFLILEGQNGS